MGPSALRLGLLRHGTAEPAISAQADAERRLEPQGGREAKSVGEAAARAGYSVVSCVSSPYPRARSTALLFLEALGAAHGPEPAVEEDHRLVPEGSVREAVDGMRERWRSVAGRPERTAGSSLPLLLFVSHEPLLSGVATRLLGRRRAPFERAELVVLAPPREGDPASGTWQEVCRILPT